MRMQSTASAPARWLQVLALTLALALTLCAAAAETTTSNATAAANATHALELQLSWRETTLLDVSLAEYSLREGARELLALVLASAIASSTNGSETDANANATALASAADAQVTDVRAVAGSDSNLTLGLSALATAADDSRSTFVVSVRVGFDGGSVDTAAAAAVAASWNSSQVTRALASRLEQDVATAVAAASDGLSADAGGGAAVDGGSGGSESNGSSAGEASSVAVGTAPLLRLLDRFSPEAVAAAASVVAYASLAATGTSDSDDVLMLTLTLRNVVDPVELPRAVVWQAQVGLARFLSPVLGVPVMTSGDGDSVADNAAAVEPVGTAQPSNRSVLLVKQQLALVLPRALAVAAANATVSSPVDDAALLLTTRVLNLTRSADRRALATLIRFGDPTRPVDDAAALAARPSLFLDYIFPREALGEALASAAVARASSFHRALFPFVFAGVSVLDPRLAAIEEAEGLTDSASASTTTIPAVSSAAMRVRRVQWFRFDPDAYYAALPANVSYPPIVNSSNSTADANATVAATSAGNASCPFAFCTSLYWSNAVGRGFWLESVESSDQFAWSLFPSERLCSPTSSTPSLEPGASASASADADADAGEEAQLAAQAQLLPAALVEAEAGKTPVWTLGALTGLRTSRLDLALHLRSEDGATRLTVELATDIQSPLDASATVTSIARLANTSDAPAIFETSSNLVVSARSRFRYADGGSNSSSADGREMLLFLEIREAQVTQKDTTQPCAHCQALFDWCANDVQCAELLGCVAAGADLDAVAQSMLLAADLSAAINRSTDVWPAATSCLQPALETAATVDAALLLASAVRCQMQRLCPFRAVAAAYNSTGDEDDVSDERILLWESGVAHHQLTLTMPAASSVALAPAVNVSMRLAGQTLCFLSLSANVTGEWIEDAIARECRYAKYLGRVLPTVVSSTTDANASTASTIIDLGYKYLVGPMPTLQVEVVGTSANATAVVSTSAEPRMFLIAETKAYASGGNLLPPPPVDAAVPPSECSKCSRLALDVCLRDSACIAFTDCILRSASASNASTAATADMTLGDDVFDMFKRQHVGENVSLQSAIDACHSSDLSTHASWLKLVRASACFSRTQCPISLALLLPSPASVTTAGRWRLSPALRRQKLYYRADDNATASTLRVPLQLMTDGTVTKSTSSSLDPLALQTNLRRLLKFDDIYVSLLIGSADGSDTASDRVWEISYANWLGSLPAVVAAELVPTWSLASIPALDESELEDVLVEMISVANSTAGTSGATVETTAG